LGAGWAIPKEFLMIRNTLAAVAAAALLAPFAASAETPDTQNVQDPSSVAAPVTAAPVAPPADVAPPAAPTSPDAQAAPSGPPTAETAQAPNVPTSAFTEAQLQAFAEASVEIEAIKARADANGGLDADSTAAIRASLTNHQLTLDSYNAIVAAIQTDTVLAERVASLRTQAATTEGAG
jgi:hemolysin activation/secretion protein